MADELEIREEEFAPVEEIVKEPEIPEADFVFDEVAAEMWLTSVSNRKRNAFRSVRFELMDDKVKNFSMLLSFAANAFMSEIKNRRGIVIGEGVLYVPNKFASREELSGLKRGKKVGKFTAFTK